MGKGKALVVLVLVAALAGFGGWAMSSAGAKTKVHARPAAVPFGRHISIGCDVEHGVQTYVSDVRVALAVVQNGCTEPDIQNRVKVRVNAARGVILYQLHHDANGTGPIMDIDAVPWGV